MGHDQESTIIYVGLARLPQPCVAPEPTVAVEVEGELGARRIVAVNSTLQLPGLERLLREVLVGKSLDNGAHHAVLELDVRYSAPFSTAIRAAVQAAMRRAADGAPRACQEQGQEKRPALSSI